MGFFVFFYSDTVKYIFRHSIHVLILTWSRQYQKKCVLECIFWKVHTPKTSHRNSSGRMFIQTKWSILHGIFFLNFLHGLFATGLCVDSIHFQFVIQLEYLAIKKRNLAKCTFLTAKRYLKTNYATNNWQKHILFHDGLSDTSRSIFISNIHWLWCRQKKECNVYIRRMHIIYRARLELYTCTRVNSAAVFRIKAK